ncbi:MAG TPA: metallophosphoesterase family protein, partial [Polyangia bacterium]|nr:metallophosphoesterase family protein [Polyangia bacterium]
HLAHDDLFPMAKMLDFVRLWAVDTTARTFATSSNGYWSEEDDELLRDDTAECAERRILAIHHPPYPDDEQRLGKEMPFGFPPAEFARLSEFVADAQVDAVVCGHLHDPGDDPWTWNIDQTKCPAFLMGRTGGMHDQAPCFGLLTVPERGRPTWRTVRF